jgi:L-threonylcarbamoyladenylate synthase
MIVPFLYDVENCLRVLKSGGTILYPTDTIWGIGCDATNSQAVEKIFQIKKRTETKSLVVLVADEKSILNYIAAPDLAVFDFINKQERPTTIVFENAIGLAENIIAQDGSAAIRIVKDEFCKHLIRRFRKPVVSTSANISGKPAPVSFTSIDDEIRNNVDYIVKWRRDDKTAAAPSQIIKWNKDGTVTVLRS